MHGDAPTATVYGGAPAAPMYGNASTAAVYGDASAVLHGDELPESERRERSVVRTGPVRRHEPVAPKQQHDVGTSTSRWTPDHEGTMLEGGPVGGTSLTIDEEL